MMPNKNDMVNDNREVKDAVITDVDKEEISNDIDDSNDGGKTKAYFFPRVIAYIIDIFIVSFIISIIGLIIPANQNYQAYLEEYNTVQTEFMEEKITANEYMNRAVEIIYDMDYSNVLIMILEVVLIILYFIVFQFYNKGQTFGKKLMKLRVVSTDGDSVTMNQIAIRALIINSILINILIIGSLLFLGRDYYYYVSLIIQRVSVIITFIIVIMVFLRKDGRGLHDVLAKTQVIQEEV